MQLDKFSKRTIVVLDNQYEVYSFIKKGRDTVIITSCQLEFVKKQISSYQLYCQDCNKIKELFEPTTAFFNTLSWICQSCNQTGTKNSFYGKKWSEHVDSNWLLEYKKKRSEQYSGSKNPMYGKTVQEVWKEKYSEEEYQIIKASHSKKLSSSMSGSKNPFYGKTHSKESMEKALKNRKDWYDKNGKLAKISRHEKNGLTKDKINNLLEHYIKHSKFGYGASSIEEETGIDRRTFKSLVCLHGIKTKDEIKEIFARGKREKFISAPELKLYQLCVNEFGKENVISQFPLYGRIYDILIGTKLLIEYDGYYFHQEISDGVTDLIKDQIAAENKYQLIRIKEDKNRKVDFEVAIKQIKEAYAKI